MLLSGGRYDNIYIAVPSESAVQTVSDLRGKRVAVFKGTAQQLAANRILAQAGLKESDVRTLNMDLASTRAALVTRDVDAAFGGSDLLQLRDQGAVRIIYTTRGQGQAFTSNGTILGGQSFIDRYPQHTQRFVNVLLGAAKWLGERDREPAEAFMLWTRSGVQFSNYKEDFLGGPSGPAGESVKRRTNPLLDPYIAARYTENIADARRFGLLRAGFNWEDWIEPRFLTTGLRELGLEGYWKPDAPPGASKLAAL